MKTLVSSVLVMAAASIASAQSPEPTFDIATIKPHDPAVLGFGMQIKGRRLTTVASTLDSLIAFAYALHPRQIVESPGWAETEKYDIVAETLGEEDKANNDTMLLRTQKLLADRFALRFHREQRTLAVYEIVVAKNGPQFLDRKGDDSANPGYGFGGLGVMNVQNAAISNFAIWMQRYVLDRPLVDHTGIKGRYNFTLTWQADEFQFPAIAASLPHSADESERSDLYTAMQQQLGLKLETTKALVDVLVIDRAERPSEN